MLDRRDDELVALGKGVHGPEDGKIVRFRARPREKNLAAFRPEGRGDALAGLVKDFLDLPADGVERRRVPEMLFQEPVHFIGDGGIDRCRGVMVEIDHGTILAERGFP
jgi:hypothetical protein